MNVVHQASDFDFLLDIRNADGEPIGFPQCDFSVRLFTAHPAHFYTASSVGGVRKNLRAETDGVRVMADSHRLAPGQMHMLLTFQVPDPDYPDQFQRLTYPFLLDLSLTSDFASLSGGGTPCFVLECPGLRLEPHAVPKDAYLTVTPEEIFLSQAQLEGEVFVISNTEWQATLNNS